MSTEPSPIVIPEPTHDERTLALLAHILQIFSGILAPLIIFCLNRDSRFVRFHALQALLWQLFYIAIFFLCILIFVFTLFATSLHHPPGPHAGPPALLLVSIPLIGLFAMGGWTLNLILGIVYGLKAYRGEWAAYPVFGSWLLPKFSPASSPTTGSSLTA